MKSRMVPQLRMFLRMAGLTLLWCVAVGAANHAAAGDWLTFEHTVANLLDCAKVGALLGVIAVAVALLFGCLHNPGRFKLVMALGICALPACMTIFALCLISIFSVEWSFTSVFQSLTLLSNLPFAYWFSQIVARKYLREISPRKRKVKSA